MKELPKKIKVKIDGIMYQLPSTCVRDQNDGGVSKLVLGSTEVALLLRQYIKTEYPQYKAYVNSEKYAGGSSIRIYLSEKDGGEILENDYELINDYAKSFKTGQFDGMTDSYNYINNTRRTSLGNEVSSYTSYIFVYNRPKEGTFEWGLKKILIDGLEFDEVVWGFSESVKKRLKKYLEQPYISQLC